jgi:nuclear pore complex protein Nup93
MGPSYASTDGDIGAWGRNWHEMVILSGIEVQRQKVSKLSLYPWVWDYVLMQSGDQVVPDPVSAANAKQVGGREGSDPAGRAGSDGRRAREAGGFGERGFGRVKFGQERAWNKHAEGGLLSALWEDLCSCAIQFPMAQSTLGKSAESREGGLVMHTKMVRYEGVVSVRPACGCTADE